MRATCKSSMHLNSHVIEEMRWWHDEMHQWSGKVIISARCQKVVMANASSHGGGGLWRPFCYSGKLQHKA